MHKVVKVVTIGSVGDLGRIARPSRSDPAVRHRRRRGRRGRGGRPRGRDRLVPRPGRRGPDGRDRSTIIRDVELGGDRRLESVEAHPALLVELTDEPGAWPTAAELLGDENINIMGVLLDRHACRDGARRLRVRGRSRSGTRARTALDRRRLHRDRRPRPLGSGRLADRPHPIGRQAGPARLPAPLRARPGRRSSPPRRGC